MKKLIFILALMISLSSCFTDRTYYQSCWDGDRRIHLIYIDEAGYGYYVPFDEFYMYCNKIGLKETLAHYHGIRANYVTRPRTPVGYSEKTYRRNYVKPHHK